MILPYFFQCISVHEKYVGTYYFFILCGGWILESQTCFHFMAEIMCLYNVHFRHFKCKYYYLNMRCYSFNVPLQSYDGSASIWSIYSLLCRYNIILFATFIAITSRLVPIATTQLKFTAKLLLPFSVQTSSWNNVKENIISFGT